MSDKINVLSLLPSKRRRIDMEEVNKKDIEIKELKKKNEDLMAKIEELEERVHSTTSMYESEKKKTDKLTKQVVSLHQELSTTKEDNSKDKPVKRPNYKKMFE
jgi:peptidoglycan hydrolase CwlO-like protein